MAGRQRSFSEVILDGEPLWQRLEKKDPPASFEDASQALDFLHIDQGLLSHYTSDYPLVESRELVPSFDAPLIEYKDLPAFSMMILDRPISYQEEGFQFDWLPPDWDPPDSSQSAANRQMIKDRLPRNLVSEMDAAIKRSPATPLYSYLKLLPFLIHMDRGHLVARDDAGRFHLAGIYASFPSDLDGEIKRLGRSMGKFDHGDNQRYADNRLFVYRFLMEQSGFPICGERHTSAALFARRLIRRRERFCIKVLGQSDRVITTLTSRGSASGLPMVYKTALMALPKQAGELETSLEQGGFFVDRKRRVVLLRVAYMSHGYHKNNVLEDRALSVEWQEVVHPATGQTLKDIDVLGMGSDRLLLLNDIVRGECSGSIVYHGRERIVGTAETDRRLKFISAWLTKHRHIVADYAPDNFENVRKVLSSYLDDPDHKEDLANYPELTAEVRSAMTDLWVAHRLRLLEKLVTNRRDASGRRLQHAQVLTILAHILAQEGHRIAKDHPRSFKKLLSLCHRQLDNRYLKQRYLTKPAGTRKERQVVSEFKLLSALVARFEQMLSK